MKILLVESSRKLCVLYHIHHINTACDLRNKGNLLQLDEFKQNDLFICEIKLVKSFTVATLTCWKEQFGHLFIFDQA